VRRVWLAVARPDAPSFSDGTGHVIGHWRTDLPAAGQAGVLPCSYVTSLDDTLRAAAGHGAELVTPPSPEGNPLDSRHPRPCRSRHRQLAGRTTLIPPASWHSLASPARPWPSPR